VSLPGKIALAVIACVVSCGGNKRCDDAVAHQRAQRWGNLTPATASERCSKDHWSDAAVDCFLHAQTLEQSQHCVYMLTPEQYQAMTATIGHRSPE